MGAGGRKNHDLSARDFKAPLLAALADLSDNTANTAVPFKQTWAPICGSMGVTLDEYGDAEKGKTWVQTWIGWAFRHLKSEGLGVSKGRGKWALTDAGIEAAKAIARGVSPKASPAAVAAKDDDSAAAPAQKPAAPQPTIGVTYNVGPGSDDAGYHNDPYIRALAANGTKCFGCFSPRSNTCGNCGLSGACQNLVAAELSALAAKLQAEDEAGVVAKTAEKVEEAEAKPEPAPAKPKGTWNNDGAESIVAHVKATCYRCGGEIAPGSNCYWLRDKDGQKGGLFHTDCR